MSVYPVVVLKYETWKYFDYIFNFPLKQYQNGYFFFSVSTFPYLSIRLSDQILHFPKKYKTFVEQIIETTLGHAIRWWQPTCIGFLLAIRGVVLQVLHQRSIFRPRSFFLFFLKCTKLSSTTNNNMLVTHILEKNKQDVLSQRLEYCQI